MNILMLSLLYPEDQLDEITRNTKDKLQNQINNYQRAFIDGIRSNLRADEKLDVLNCLPVGIFPLQYRQLFLRNGLHDQGTIRQLGCINLPWLKQNGRKHSVYSAIERWLKQSPENRTVLLYTQYLPYMEAVAKLKKRYPDLKAAVIVTDLPNELGLASGRKGILKKIEYQRGSKSMALCQQMDGFILLTQPMADALKVSHKPYVVIEGLIRPQEENHSHPKAEAFSVLYTGTLEPDLGIRDLLNAFMQRPQYELWICGHGSLQQEIQDVSVKHTNIKFYGFVPQKEALALQAKASALINPRSPEGLFTKYSFPSKTLEYLRSGKPVLCYKLEGIPDDYDRYLQYITDSGSDGILQTIDRLAELSENDRNEIGASGRDFVLRAKNPHVQCEKLIALLRQL